MSPVETGLALLLAIATALGNGLKAYQEKRITKESKLVIVAGSIVGQPSSVTNLIQILNTADIVSPEMTVTKYNKNFKKNKHLISNNDK